MNSITMIVGVTIACLVVLAVYGSYRTLHSERCCDGKNCTSCKTEHCSIRREDNRE